MQREPELLVRREEITKAPDAVREAIVKEHLDRDALEHALADPRPQLHLGQELTHQAISEASTRSALEQRRKMADKFEAGKP